MEDAESKGVGVGGGDIFYLKSSLFCFLLNLFASCLLNEF